MTAKTLTLVHPFVLAAAALLIVSLGLHVSPVGLIAQAVVRTRTFALDTTVGLISKGVDLESVEYRGRSAVRVTELPGTLGDKLALVDGAFIQDGTIEVFVAGFPAPGSVEGARGFIGIAFRLRPDARHFECLYIRPTNGRAEDQLRRNHTTQYVSHPDFPWQRLRQETPGVYESYADLEPGVWTSVKIVVSGVKAQLYLHGASQPALIVNDLKMGTEGGGVALWIGPGTEGYFSGLKILS